MRLDFGAAASLVGMLAFGSAHAAYPERAVTLVVPYTPAGISDGIGRIVAEAMGKELGKAVIVENRAGANTMIGAQYVSRAKPDGYTLLLSSSASMVVNPLVYKKVGYDSKHDFRQVAVLAVVPLVVVTNPKTGANTLSEFATDARQKSGAWNYASVGLGNPLQIATETLKSELGIELTHVPYPGSAPALSSLLANDTQLMIDTLSTSLPYIKAGTLKALAVTTEARNKLLPQTPTVAEAGHPGFRASTWFGIAVPASTPPQIVAQLQTVLRKVVSEPTVVAWFDMQGLVLQAARTDAELNQYVDGERAAWEKTVKTQKIMIDN